MTRRTRINKLTGAEASLLPSFNKHRGEEFKNYIVSEKEEIKSPKNNNDEENISMISNHEQAERISILKLIQIAQQKVNNIQTAFSQFSKRNK